ncbi:MAG: arylamine N-acetyltransferase [Planctomycetota bacterium]
MTLDLDAYFARIGYHGARAATGDTLRALHEAHVEAIPFENLAIQLGELPLRLDLGSLQHKLVQRRRGGYCFEQNLLFAAVLETLGFQVARCEARVRSNAQRVLARTHLTLVVTVGDAQVLCDVGFGGEGLLWPVPIDGAEHAQGDVLLRVQYEDDLLVLQSRPAVASGGGVLASNDLYAFRPVAIFAADWEMANWYTSTYPESRFVTTLTAQRRHRLGRQVLRGLTYAETVGATTTIRELARADLVPLLRAQFGLELPVDAAIRSLDRSAC